VKLAKKKRERVSESIREGRGKGESCMGGMISSSEKAKDVGSAWAFMGGLRCRDSHQTPVTGTLEGLSGEMHGILRKENSKN